MVREKINISFQQFQFVVVQSPEIGRFHDEDDLCLVEVTVFVGVVRPQEIVDRHPEIGVLSHNHRSVSAEDGLFLVLRYALQRVDRVHILVADYSMANRNRARNHVHIHLDKHLPCITCQLHTREAEAERKKCGKSPVTRNQQNIVRRKKCPDRRKFHRSIHRIGANIRQLCVIVHHDQSLGTIKLHGIVAVVKLLQMRQMCHGHRQLHMRPKI